MLVYHVVGVQGVGKSSLIRLMAADFERRGRVCAGHDPCIFSSTKQAVGEQPGADVYFIEHLPDETFNVEPGEFVIHMQRVPAANDPHTAQAAEQGVVHG